MSIYKLVSINAHNNGKCKDAIPYNQGGIKHDYSTQYDSC